MEAETHSLASGRENIFPLHVKYSRTNQNIRGNKTCDDIAPKKSSLLLLNELHSLLTHSCSNFSVALCALPASSKKGKGGEMKAFYRGRLLISCNFAELDSCIAPNTILCSSRGGVWSLCLMNHKIALASMCFFRGQTWDKRWRLGWGHTA